MKTFETRKGWRFRGLPIHRTRTPSRPHGPPLSRSRSKPPPCRVLPGFLSAGRLLPFYRPRPPSPPGASCHPPSPPGASSLTVARRLPVRRRWKAKVAVARGATVEIEMSSYLSAGRLLPVRLPPRPCLPPPAGASGGGVRRRRERRAERSSGSLSEGRRGESAAAWVRSERRSIRRPRRRRRERAAAARLAGDLRGGAEGRESEG